MRTIFGMCGSLYQKCQNQKRFHVLKNHRVKDQRHVFTGNGPRLNQNPLERWEIEYILGINGRYLLYDDISWRSKYYCAFNHLVAPSISSQIDTQFLQCPDTSAFMQERYTDLQDRDDINWTREKSRDYSLEADDYFATRSPDSLRISKTVTISCIAIEVFIGINPIYLILS